MSVSSKIHNIQLVKIQPDERLATTSELNLAPSRVTGGGEARGMGYWAATQVKGLSPEITVVSAADVELKDCWQMLKQKLVGHYRYYGISGNIPGLRKYYNQTLGLAFKWINQRSQKRSYDKRQFYLVLSFNPLLQTKIYHLTYTLSIRRGCTPEESDEGKPQVRFCEGGHCNPGVNTPIGGGL